MKRLVWIVSVLLMSTGVVFAQQTFYFPQIAAGTDPAPANTHWDTTIFLSNPGSAVASGTVTFFRSDGGPMNISFVDESGQGAGGGNTITFQLSPGANKKYTCTAGGGLQVGYAIVSSNAAIAGNAMFSHVVERPNETVLIGEAGVQPALLPRQAVFADTQSGFNTGVAVANPGNTAVSVTYQLVNSQGQVVASSTETLPAGQHTARFVTELFSNQAALAGRLQILASGGSLAAVALRFDRRFERFTTLFPFVVP